LQRIILAALLVLTLSGSYSCENTPSGEQHVAPAPTPPPKATSLTLPVASVQIIDGRLKKDAAILLSGDRRPLYIVDGRIYNTNGYRTLTKVGIRITVVDGSDSPIDGADLDLAIRIPPSSVRGFSRQIQLLPPADGSRWSWNWAVVSVEAEP
jgi:hypothetical protein